MLFKIPNKSAGQNVGNGVSTNASKNANDHFEISDRDSNDAQDGIHDCRADYMELQRNFGIALWFDLLSIFD